MSKLPNCPQCNSEYTYEDGEMYVCPECGHEWSKTAEAEAEPQGSAAPRGGPNCNRRMTRVTQRGAQPPNQASGGFVAAPVMADRSCGIPTRLIAVAAACVRLSRPEG